MKMRVTASGHVFPYDNRHKREQHKFSSEKAVSSNLNLPSTEQYVQFQACPLAAPSHVGCDS